MISPFSKSLLVSFASIGLLTFLLSQKAAAQGYSSAGDPLVQRTINHGEQMRMTLPNATNTDTGAIHFSEDKTSLFLAIPPRPPALGEAAAPMLAGAAPTPSFDRDLERERFYGAYATLVPEKDLSKKQADRIAAYRAARQSLLQEIRSKLSELSNVDATARRTALAELASRQDERLRSLDAEAEALRQECGAADRSLAFALAFEGGSKESKNQSLRTSFQLFISAYFDLGLSPEQQLLLTEIAYDERTDLETSPAEADYLEFLPATSRVRLPANLPAALSEKINQFAHNKQKLKSDLRAAVLDHADFAHARQRTKRLTTLAEEQAAPFAALDALAEEIRIGLANLDQNEPPAPTSLPADLTRRVGDFNARKSDTQRELRKRLRDLSAEFPKAKFAIEHRGNALAISQTGASRKTVAALEEFNASFAKRYADFARESEVLRRDVHSYAESRREVSTRTVDQVAADFLKAYEAQEKWNHDREYSNAILEPGLSPAQRTLYYHAVISGADQNGLRAQR